MSFCHAVLTLKDLDASIAFYRDIVGLPVKVRQPAGPNGELAFLGEGGTLVELLCSKTPFHNEGNEAGNGVALGFEVGGTLEDKMALLREKGYKTDDAITSLPNVKFFFAKDPDGYNVQFIKR